MKATCTLMKVIERMKYLDERGTLMKFWMIIGNRQKNWMKILTN
jgi:hypothetical protein